MMIPRIVLPLLSLAGLAVSSCHARAQEPPVPAPASGPVVPAPAAPPRPQPVPEPTDPSPAPVITSQLSAQTVSVGDQAVLSYRILNAPPTPDDFPREIVIPDLTVRFSGSSNRSVLANGVPSRALELRYLAQPAKAGNFTIPPQIIRLNGQDYSTPAVSFTVRDDPASADGYAPTAQLTLGKTEMWKGEVVPVAVAVLIHPSVQPAGQFTAQLKSTSAAVNRFDRSAGIQTRIINGEPWRSWQVESVMTPLMAGMQKFGPAEVKLDVFLPQAGGYARDPFGSMGSPSNRKALTLISNSTDINVKELPTEGKPENFTGAVGDFDLEITATPTTLNVGEPIAVEIAIDGMGNFDAVASPAMESKEGWRAYEPRVAQENRGWGTEVGRRSFTQILIPEKNLTELPSFVLHYFDPEKGVYVTKKSPPVKLTVNGEPTSVAAAVEVKDFNAIAAAQIPGEELNDILTKPLTGGPWLATASLSIPTSPILLHGVPAAFLALVLGAGAARRIRAAAAARRPASDAPRPAADVYSDLRRNSGERRKFYALATEFLESVRFHHPGIPIPSTPEFTALLAARDQHLYGPDLPESAEPLPADERKSALALLSKLPHSA